jgi:protein phosphatase
MKQTVSLGRASRILGVAPSTLRGYCNQELIAYRTLPSGHRRFDLATLYRWKRIGNMKFEHTAHQLQGPRDYQQDHALLLPEYGCFAVADGMGGMEHGDLASGLAVQFLREKIPVINWPGREAPDRMRAILTQCNDYVLSHLPDGSRSGTTLSLLVFFQGGFVCLGHIGDSRIYRVRSGACVQLTTDHSAPDPFYGGREVVTSSIGGEERIPFMQANLRSWRPGDCFLICSDGFFGAIEDSLRKRGQSKEDAERNTRSLLARFADDGMSANHMNSHVEKTCSLSDNSTVVCVRV